MAREYTYKDYEKYQQALQKAINNQETPVKQKHVRSAIIGTFHTQGAKTFWAIALRLPSMDDCIVAWKLCHVVHKILREGHPLCLEQSQKHRAELDEIGKLWGHLKDGYGRMIRLYTLLLITKLEFHRRNPRFPGHLGVTHEELESINGNDINNYFEMSVEMFDYLDNILDLQEAVFGSLNMARSNSMTSAGQCRLAPLVPCIQEASKLYDYCVKMLFKLHGALPPDTLAGHRERFLKQFKALKRFYESISNLQYFRDLISIPPLPENPPNFLTSDCSTYITQEVVIPPQAPEPDEEPIMEGDLIDTNDVSPPVQTVTLTEHQEILREKEIIKQNCERLRTEFERIVTRNQQEINLLHNKITSLETELATKDSELVQERQIKEELMSQAFNVAQSQDTEQKERDEKFAKLKDVYYKLRNTHINILREKADVDKKLDSALKKIDEVENIRQDLESKLNGMEEAQTKQDEFMKLYKASEEQLENLRRDKDLFTMETEILKKSVNDACKERDSIQIELTSTLQEKDELKKKSEELSYKLLDCERQLDQERKNLQMHLKSMVAKTVTNSEEILKQSIDEVDNPALTALTCSPDYLNSLSKEALEALQKSLNIPEENYAEIIITANKITHVVALFILQGRATCNTSPDITFGEKMAEACKELGSIVLKLLNCLKNFESGADVVAEAIKKLNEIASLAENINTSLLGEKPENLADMLENEMIAMDKAIEEAANRIQEMLTNSRAGDSGVKLEVNEKILDTCTRLMQAIRILVQKSRLLQAEIVAQGKGTASAKDFYKRNHQWTDGFISAAKAVAVAAKFLLTAADKVVTSTGKLEQLVVASQEISASTAQLVVASRVKANRNSTNLKQLTQASKDVTTATATVVATVKDCGQLIEEAEELDVSNMSLHQAKRLEMEAQVRVLELEKELQQERYRLAALRRHHYQLAGENDE